MKIDARLTFEKINSQQGKDAHLVVSLTAPPKVGATRPAICIGLCIDISGSMQGPKLDYAKKSAIKVVEHLKAGDYCGVVAFESEVHVTMAPVMITPENKEKLKRAIQGLTTKGSTNFAGGMLKTLELMQNLDLPANVLHRAVMLTDGQANMGPVTTTEDIIKVYSANCGRVTASAFGYGAGVNQDFLTKFASAGNGNYAFIAEPDAALTAFGNELGGLLSTYAMDIKLDVTSLANHMIDSVVTNVPFDVEPIGNIYTIKIHDILAEETRNFVFGVKLGEQKQVFPRPVNVFEANVSYDILDEDGRKVRKTAETKAKATFVDPGDEQTKPDTDLDTVVGLAQVVRAQIEAEEKAKKGDFDGASEVMKSVTVKTGARGLENIARSANNLRMRYGDRVAYSAGASYRATYQAAGVRPMSVALSEESAMEDLRDAGASFSNSLRDECAESFTSDDKK